MGSGDPSPLPDCAIHVYVMTEGEGGREAAARLTVRDGRITTERPRARPDATPPDPAVVRALVALLFGPAARPTGTD